MSNDDLIIARNELFKKLVKKLQENETSIEEKRAIATDFCILYGNMHILTEKQIAAGYYLDRNFKNNRIYLMCNNPEAHIDHKEISLLFFIENNDIIDDDIISLSSSDLEEFSPYIIDEFYLIRRLKYIWSCYLDYNSYNYITIVDILTMQTNNFSGYEENVNPVLNRILTKYNLSESEEKCNKKLPKPKNKKYIKAESRYTAIIKLKDLSDGEYKDGRAFDRINGLVNLFNNNYALMRFTIGRGPNQMNLK